MEHVRSRQRSGVLAAALAVALPASQGTRAQEAETTSAQQAEIARQMCEQTICQHDLRIQLKRKDGSPYDRTFDVFPGAIQPIGIFIVPGQTLHVEAGIRDGRLVDMRVVEAIADPTRTITAKLEQDPNGQMLLSVSNPFGKPLKFDMGMMPLDSDGLYRTSSCPVIPGGHAFEMWPYPIFQLVLGNPRLLDPDADMACTE